MAELLLARYPDERDAAIEHLDFAIAEFQDMKPILTPPKGCCPRWSGRWAGEGC